MLVSDFLSSVGYTLQDSPHTRWTVAELTQYINDGLKDIASRSLCFEGKDTFTMLASQTDYILSNIPIKVDSIEVSNAKKFICSLDYKTLTFAAPEDGYTIVVSYRKAPDVVTNITLNLDFAHNVIDSLRCFVLMRCYEKDETTENFNKAATFERKYRDTLSENASGVMSTVDYNIYQGDFLWRSRR